MTCKARHLLLVVILSSGAVYAQEPSLLMRYFFEPESSQQVSVTSESEIDLGSVAMSERREQIMLVSPTLSRGGDTSLGHQISRQTLWINGDGVEVNFDTASIDAPTIPVRLSQLSESVGHRFHLEVDGRGQSSLTDDGDLPASIVEMSLIALPVLPEERVGIGDVWETVSTVRLSPTEQMLVSRRYYLSSVNDGVAVATYELATSGFAIVGTEQIEGAPQRLARGELRVTMEGAGRFLFDLQRGRLMSLSESTRLEGSMNGLPMTVSTDWAVVIE